MNLKQQIAEACATHDIYDVLGVDHRKMSFLCPLPGHIHHHNTPSFAVFTKDGKQYWKCHGACNREGDVVDLVGELRIPGYDKRNREHVARALAELDNRFPFSVPRPAPPAPQLHPERWRDFVPPGQAVLDYARQRGLSAATLAHFRVGQRVDEHGGTWMAMPCFVHGVLVGIKHRRTGPGRLRYLAERGSRQGLFNHDAVYLTTDPVLVVKAEIPVMLLHEWGYLACAPTGGEAGWNEEWRTGLALAPKVLVGDNDTPGRRLGEKRSSLLGAILKFPPDPYKDIDAFMLAEPEAARATIDRWLREALW